MRDPQQISTDDHFSDEPQGIEEIGAGRTLPSSGKASSKTPKKRRAINSGKARKSVAYAEETPTSLDEIESHLQESATRALRARAGTMYHLLSRLALSTASFSSWLYDCQMNLGKGVRAVSHRLQLPNYPTGAPSLKVAYLSDLHYGPTTGRVAVRQAWKMVHDARPDVILLGGDYLFADERGLPTFLRELQRWQFSPPSGGIYACLGNHDYLAGKETIVTTLEACGVRVLVNDAVPLPSPWKGVWIAGVDNAQYGAPDLPATLGLPSPDACTILLSHEPDICKSPLLRKVGITLAGHTHGGQVCMPSGDPIFLPASHGREYSSGLHRHAGQWLFVSRGVGTVGVPVRLFAPPDVGLFEFHGRANRSAR